VIGRFVDLEFLFGSLWRVMTLEDRAFETVATDDRLRRVGLLLPALLIALGGVATVLYRLVLENAADTDRSEAVIRFVVIGTPVTFGLWVLWALLIEGSLRFRWRVPVDRGGLLGAMGFASWPLVALWLYWVPDWLQGSQLTFGHTSVWIIASVGVAWLVYTLRAARAAIPAAREGWVTIVTTGSFIVLMGVFMGLANKWAVAPWISPLTRATDKFVG
jgi:hypothetical protein